MQKDIYLVITSISDQKNLVLKKYAEESSKNKIPFVVIGDSKSPKEFHLDGCDFYSLERQKKLGV